MKNPHAENALKTHNLTIHYNDIPVLWDINLEVPRGKKIGILGPNGAGKSTLMKACLGLIPTAAGSIWILGHKLQSVRKKIAYVPQKESVDWDFPITVEELVLMGCYPKRGLFSRIKQSDYEAALKSLEAVGMKDYRYRQISQLSGGQQQRAFFARALMQDADIYFLDEPLAGVDHASEKIIMQVLSDLQKENKTILMIHHDLYSVEKYFDWLIVLNVRLLGCGPTKDVFSKDVLEKAYGKNFTLFDEAFKRSQGLSEGLP